MRDGGHYEPDPSSSLVRAAVDRGHRRSCPRGSVTHAVPEPWIFNYFIHGHLPIHDERQVQRDGDVHVGRRLPRVGSFYGRYELHRIDDAVTTLRSSRGWDAYCEGVGRRQDPVLGERQLHDHRAEAGPHADTDEDGRAEGVTFSVCVIERVGVSIAVGIPDPVGVAIGKPLGRCLHSTCRVELTTGNA